MHDFWHRLRGDERGAIAILLGLAITALVGFIALAVEVSMWWQTQQKMQNASDAASISASLNYKKTKDKVKAQNESDALVTSSDRYNLPASKYNIEYTWTSSAGASCSTDCKSVQVDITSQPDALFSAVLGNFMSGSNKIKSSATASLNQSGDACILALGRSTGTCGTGVPNPTMGAAGTYSGEGLRFNGSPNVNLANCGLKSDATGTSSTNCNGHELNAEFIASVGSVDAACESDASQRWANTDITPDPYDSLKSNIPASYRNGSACGALSTTTLNAPTSSRLFCGTLKINASMTLSEGTYYIVNGNLEFAKGITVEGSGVTFVLTGTNAYSHTIIDANGSGGIHFKVKAPLKTSSSAFKGIVIYQDPDLCSGTDMTSAGNGLQIETQGVWYLPTSNVTLSGAISKNADVTTQCMLMIVNTLRVNGSVTMSAAGCAEYDVSAPVITN